MNFATFVDFFLPHISSYRNVTLYLHFNFVKKLICKLLCCLCKVI